MSTTKIKVMISSRCADSFPLVDGQPLTELRRELKRRIEAEKLFGKQVFEVWINEDAEPEPGANDSLDTCLTAVRESDILLVLYNGNAGWSIDSTGNGICHDELMTGYSESPAKVVVVSIHEPHANGAPSGELNERFQSYVNELNLFRGGEVQTTDQLYQRVNQALFKVFRTLFKDGVRDAKRSANDSGPALNWSRMSFQERHSKMVDVVIRSLLSVKGAVSLEGIGGVEVPIQGKKLLFLANAIPSAFTISSAREMVGQPFLADHRHVEHMKVSKAGPVHIIACQKTITESQAIKLLGFPDATIVPSAFGVYVADRNQMIQMCMITNCQDEATTRHAIQRFLEWLEKTGEGRLLSSRARSRYRIAKLIADETEKVSER